MGAGFAGGGTELIVWRIAQGVGGAFLFANAGAIVTDAFPREQLGLAMGTNTMVAAVGLVIGAAIGGLAYSALFLALSVMTKRPVAVGLVYIMLWENLLVSFVSGTRVFSVQQHATAIADSIGNTQLLDSSLSVTTALIMSVLFIAVGTFGATQRLRSFALTGEAN